MKKFFLFAMLFAVTTISLICQVNPRMVKDINFGTGSSLFIPNVVQSRDVLNDVLYFVANDGIHGSEIWKSVSPYDEQSTSLVKDMTAGPTNWGATGHYTSAFNKIFFFNSDGTYNGLSMSDGTEQGTRVVGPVVCANNQSCNVNYPIASSQGKIFWSNFARKNGPYRDVLTGMTMTLWKTDPSTGTTVKVKDFNSIENWLEDVNGTLVFIAKPNNGNFGLWKSNGTSTGTVAVYTSFNPVNLSGYPTSQNGHPYYYYKTRFVSGGNLYFASSDATYGTELWKTNGTAAGTTRLTDINPGTGNSAPAMGAIMNGFLYFSANDGTNGYQIWKIPLGGGTATRVTNIDGGTTGADPMWLTAVGNTLFFSAYSGLNGRELWKTDGVPFNESVIDINSGTASSNPNYFNYQTDTDWEPKYMYSMALIGNYIYFAADDGNGYNLWRSDGETTGEVYGINEPLNPKHLTPVKGKLMYAATTTAEGCELWIYDPALEMKKRGDDAIILDSKDCAINIYPNPADDQLTIDGEFSNKIDVEARLSNILGMEILNFSKTGVKNIHENLNISNLAPGMYIIEMRYGNETIQRKIIKR
jgi:trimeric autotransporter adhesin